MEHDSGCVYRCGHRIVATKRLEPTNTYGGVERGTNDSTVRLHIRGK